MGRQHVRDGVLHVRQEKTNAALAIPVHSELARVLAAVPSTQMTFIQTLKGKYTDGPNASANNIEIAGLFWHFVDLVWILVFTFIYLI